MAWTYSGNPASSTRDLVRFLISDTDVDDQLLSNEELDYLVTVWSDGFAAAIAAVRQLIAQAARSYTTSRTVGSVSISENPQQRVDQWMRLLSSLQLQRMSQFSALPVVNANAIIPTVDKDLDDEAGTDFVIGQMDNRS